MVFAAVVFVVVARRTLLTLVSTFAFEIPTLALSEDDTRSTNLLTLVELTRPLACVEIETRNRWFAPKRNGRNRCIYLLIAVSVSVSRQHTCCEPGVQERSHKRRSYLCLRMYVILIANRADASVFDISLKK